ncbi:MULTISPECIES: hypothetical protein [unclassified Pseudomonas]|uniref:hypothetical protein n=1 Tax=unclassified Pseudomonas TaxID=196821 RepID=UPI000C876690|nr:MULTISPECIES: hypothetical protein [unclassified Pseudomonas]PMU08632.1 hypothetical protein C1Y11_20885 [Pseudomonas sp. FW305-20]PMU19410.1 hypothetical protein C1Y10_09285 [Pseudomonas sp. FW305-122]PMU38525.1 hypothetical protein C1Y12_16065 [Pseudomonas sp. FW305-47B]PMX59398.1 hypothetical protein C1Y13_17545 [Pseudomonas sp. FW305-33]PMX69404.1 hypothetical protein C1X12_07630 [Pseudomonas sp. FW305-60]
MQHLVPVNILRQRWCAAIFFTSSLILFSALSMDLILDNLLTGFMASAAALWSLGEGMCYSNQLKIQPVPYWVGGLEPTSNFRERSRRSIVLLSLSAAFVLAGCIRLALVITRTSTPDLSA